MTTINFLKAHRAPSLEELTSLVESARANLGCNIEITWTIGGSNKLYRLHGRAEQLAGELSWVLKASDGLEAKQLWSAYSLDLHLVRDISARMCGEIHQGPVSVASTPEPLPGSQLQGTQSQAAQSESSHSSLSSEPNQRPLHHSHSITAELTAQTQGILWAAGKNLEQATPVDQAAVFVPSATEDSSETVLDEFAAPAIFSGTTVTGSHIVYDSQQIRHPSEEPFDPYLQRVQKQELEFLGAAAVGARFMSNQMVNQTTGLYTYPALLRFLERELYRFEVSANPVSLILVELLDKNNAPLPLRAIITASLRIALVTGALDVLGHFENNNLALVLPNTTSAIAALIANKILEALTASPLSPECNKASLKIALGIAGLPTDGENLMSMIAAAKTARDLARERPCRIYLS